MTIFKLIFAFFRTYLVNEKGLAPNTIASYAEAVKQLLTFAADKQRLPLHSLDLATFTAELVGEFLGHIEAQNSIATRNQRLGAIRTLFTYLGQRHPTMLAAAQNIGTLACKKTPLPVMDHLTDPEVRAFLTLAQAQPHPLRRTRDTALFHLLYNTGARASEIVGLNVHHVDLSPIPTVTLTGKGQKIRVLPLWSETADAITQYLALRQERQIHHEALFLNPQHQRLSRFGLRDLVERYATRLADRHPSLRRKSVTPHTFRHTTAVHLLHASNDLSLVQQWLGHADINTTSHYCVIDPETKRKALSTFRPSNKKAPACQWKDPDLLAFLTALANSQ